MHGVADFVLGHDPRSHGTEGVERLSRHAFFLAADDGINQAGIAEHIFAPGSAANVAAGFADDDGELTFVIDAPQSV